MKGWCGGHCRLLWLTLLLFLLLCPLQVAFSIGHREGFRNQVGNQLIETYSPSPSQHLSSPASSLLIPTASPIVFSPNYESSVAPSGFVPFLAPSPLEIPVVTNPTTPQLSGLCPFNFTALKDTLVRTAGDCPAPLALYVGSVICCPQLESLFQVSLGQYSIDSGNLGLNSTEAAYCFSDTENLMASLGANTSVGDLCAAQPANLTSGLCPVTKVSQLQDIVNTTKLLDACQSVDPLKECTEEPTCQSQISYGASQMAREIVDSSGHFNASIVPPGGEQEVVVDCKNMVLAWLASKLGPKAANNMLRNLISCRVNKECPLVFGDPMPVAKSCGCSILPSNMSCCSALDSYLVEVQQQMLITNLQALRCVTLLASVLQNMSVSADIYSLCGIDLKDFSLQGVGGQGCLLSSLPSDISNVTGIDFTCDLNDNIAAPWIRQLNSTAAHSICGQPPVALPALPETSRASLVFGHTRVNILIMAPCVVFFIAMWWEVNKS